MMTDEKMRNEEWKDMLLKQELVINEKLMLNQLSIITVINTIQIILNIVVLCVTVWCIKILKEACDNVMDKS